LPRRLKNRLLIRFFPNLTFRFFLSGPGRRLSLPLCRILLWRSLRQLRKRQKRSRLPPCRILQRRSLRQLRKRQKRSRLPLRKILRQRSLR
jgi:hypothetical protein